MVIKKIAAPFIKKNLPKRNKFSNKSDGGKVLIIGGGKGLYGSGILSALASTRSGAGYTHLMSELPHFPWLKFPDFILHPLKISELKNKSDYSIAIGPGMGITANKRQFITYLLKNKFEKVVIDADGLTLLSSMKIKKLPENWVLTPHEGELARLLGISYLKIKRDRETFLKLAQKKYGCHILLKGADTLIIDNLQNIYKVSEGTPALAKAGTGDVLLGIIAAFLAQNVSAKEACILASFIHGRGSKLWEKEKNDHLSMRPMDLIELLPKALYQIRTK